MSSPVDRIVPVVFTVMVCALCPQPSVGLEIPLRYCEQADVRDSAPLHISRIRVAAFDMLQEPERAPPIEIRYGTRVHGRGIQDAALADLVTTAAVTGGRPCRRMLSRGDFVLWPDPRAMRTLRGRVYVLVDWYDAFTSETLLRVTCDAGKPKPEPGAVQRDPIRVADFRTMTCGGLQAWRQTQFVSDDDADPGRLARLAAPTLRVGLLPSQPNAFCSGYSSVPLNAQQPPGRWTLPRGMAHPALFGLLPLGDRQHLVVVESPCSTSPDVRLWFDADGDSSLADDQVYFAPGSVGSRLPCIHPQVSWPGIRADVPIGDCHSPYVFRATARCATTSGSIVSGTLDIRPAGRYSGEAEIGSNRYRFILCDGNANGRFDDRPIARQSRDHGRTTARFAGGDRLLVSGEREPAADDSIQFGGPIQLGGDWYSLAFEPCKGLARLEPVANGQSMVALSCPVDRIEWASPDYSRTLAAIEPGGQVRLPDGDWRPYSYCTDRTAPDGSTWRLSARWAETSAPAIAAGKAAASLELGGPYRMVVRTVPEDRVPGIRSAISVTDAAAVHGAAHAGAQQSLLVVASLVGASGEHVTDLRCVTRAHRAPSYRLVDRRGRAVSMGALEPAGECMWMTRLTASENNGQHALHVQWDLGPFGSVESTTRFGVEQAQGMSTR